MECTVDADVLARVVRTERIGELHPTLAAPVGWRPGAANRAADAAARAWFGLRPGTRLDAELAASLTVLCRPAVEYYGWIDDGERTTAVLAACTGREAVLATRVGTEVTVRPANRNALANALVGHLPVVPRGRGDAVQVRQADLLAASAGRVRSVSGVGSVSAGRDVRYLHRLAELPTTGSGELHVAVTDGAGRRCAAEHPLRYADTPHGRFVNQTVRNDADEVEVLVAPAGPADLVARLTAVRAALTGQHSRSGTPVPACRFESP